MIDLLIDNAINNCLEIFLNDQNIERQIYFNTDFDFKQNSCFLFEIKTLGRIFKSAGDQFSWTRLSSIKSKTLIIYIF